MAGRVLLRQPQLLPTSGCLCSVPFRVRTAKSRHCSPIYAQPANGGREESGSGWSDQRDPSGLDDELRVDPGLELAANSWPRIILDEPRQQTGEMPSPEPPLRAADKARRREAALLRLATLGFAVRPSPSSFRTNYAQHWHLIGRCAQQWPCQHCLAQTPQQVQMLWPYPDFPQIWDANYTLRPVLLPDSHRVNLFYHDSARIWFLLWWWAGRVGWWTTDRAWGGASAGSPHRHPISRDGYCSRAASRRSPCRRSGPDLVRLCKVIRATHMPSYTGNSWLMCCTSTSVHGSNYSCVADAHLAIVVMIFEEDILCKAHIKILYPWEKFSACELALICHWRGAWEKSFSYGVGV